MFPLGIRRQRGATLIELMMGLAVIAFVLALGMPSMSHWVTMNKATSAGEFYAEGFSMARRQAVLHNAASRIVLSPNLANGQMDWQVDICFPVTGTPCNDQSGAWSTTTTAAANDPDGAAGFTSVFRAADSLPQSDVLAPSLVPDGASTIYFTSLGWVDTTVDARLTRIRLDPADRYHGEIPSVAVSVTLAGMATKCNPTVNAPDSRACPP
ncbi:pilus assembly FimT family protein [Pseudoduganella namucuonensis]|uniref:Type IV fimbrial biogenesis protein FimT n=1 Tax=Pseudoduganella namucuonensis TaxID=1035707 RepID=A0A1I7HRW0_9BURK|nr:prepilin-type N-terminal cleavage/methylation domain-containing protein [Pseudoduganella namucuonensis]SFU63369.1 type IV fimbrial biogenesis protein FimT [Pseudoduganella namucuonensis]